MTYKHVPVMLKEVLEYLDPRPGQFFIDCTLGGGGYTLAIAKEIGKNGKILAIDLDKMAIKNAGCKMRDAKLNNIILAHENFKNLSKIISTFFPNLSLSNSQVSAAYLLRKNNVKEAIGFAGIVFDLGLSSAQLQDKLRGFSFQLDAPLNMAFGQALAKAGQTTEYIINNWKREDLEKIIREYGEERFFKRIVKKIVEQRQKKPIKTTGQLVEIIKSAVPLKYLHSKIHPATRTFQALRIATNNELENLEQALPQAVDALRGGGRIVIVSYHSLEDRIVKKFFKKESRDCLCPPEWPVCQCDHKAKLKIISKRVIRPSAAEIKDNPRARSAKMRIAEKKQEVG